MPLHTHIIREGKPVAVRWGWFHVEAMTLASTLDSGIGKRRYISPAEILGEELAAKVQADRSTAILVTADFAREFMSVTDSPLNRGVYTLKQAWTFKDDADGEIFPLLAGDELHMYR